MAAERSLHYLRIRDQLAGDIRQGGLAAKLPGEPGLFLERPCLPVTVGADSVRDSGFQ